MNYPDWKPKFCKARPVPNAINKRTEKELNRLVKDNIYEPIQYSKWATPIIPVLKDDGTVKICGDYKQTINQASLCNKYPVPKTEDLFAPLNGGEKFSMRDLSHAYQLVLYWFGIYSSSGTFQREMQKWLDKIPFIKVQSDDILISGRNNEHLENLKSVL